MTIESGPECDRETYGVAREQMGWTRRVGWCPAGPEEQSLSRFALRGHEFDNVRRWPEPVRPRQSDRAGAQHPVMFTSGALDRGNGMAAVFADKMHDLSAMERAAFTVGGVVRATGKRAGEICQHSHNSPVCAPQCSAHPLTPQLPCRTEMLFLAVFEGRRTKRSPKRWENFYNGAYFIPASP